jgi:glucan biosynthesis protein
MRAFLRFALPVFVVVFCFLAGVAGADILENPDFEDGSLAGWSEHEEQLSVEITTNTTFNRNYAARIQGTHSGDAWVTNSIFQSIDVIAGDNLQTVGFVYWKDFIASTSAAQGRLQVTVGGLGSESVQQEWTSPHDGWIFFDLEQSLFGIADGGFESGYLDSWTVGNDDLVSMVTADEVYSGAYAMKTVGEWTGGWSFNQAIQIFELEEGDQVSGRAMINVADLTVPDVTGAWAVAGIKLENEVSGDYWEDALPANITTSGWTELSFEATIPTNGYYVFRCMVAGSSSSGTNTAEVYFDDVMLWRPTVGLSNPSFEDGTNEWTTGSDDLDIENSATQVADGTNALSMSGSWSGWSFNAAHQVITLRSGDVIEASADMYIDSFSASAGWAVAGLKLEAVSASESIEDVRDPNATQDQWTDLSFTKTITNAGEYILRAMVCGDVGGGTASADIYFDNFSLRRQGDGTGDVMTTTLQLDYVGNAGGAGETADVDIYVDSFMLDGSTANLEPATNIYTELRSAAAAVAGNPDEGDIAPVQYPPLNSYGYITGDTNTVHYPAYIEASVAGWRFRYFTNDITLRFTNTIHLYELGGEGVNFFEFDHYQYCARFWGTERGEPVPIDTNAPYFKLGTSDDSSAEFGDGPFPGEHTYVVGTSLTNFPRRMASDGSGGWPSILHIVYEENMTNYDRSYDKYFVLDTVPTNGPGSNVKALKLYLQGTDPGNTNIDFNTQEIHMGWSPEEQSQGMIDYPNLTYQDHNEVFLRAGWEYGLLDKEGWFMTPVARGSATIEPLDLFALKNGNWSQRMYEEYLFSWPNAASGVRSIFDSDYTDRLPGPGSYFVGFKIGHQFGTNEFGEPQYPGVIEIRGNGYFRMTDYDGVMGGSFRPVSHDIFGLYQNKEDAPLMPQAYTRLVPRTTPTNEPDDSFVQYFMPVRSKTNQWLTGSVKVDCHFAPDEVADEGAYFELESDVYANKAIDQDEHGKLNAFAQVDMYWRGGFDVDDHSEGHDFDAVIVKKADGEWVTHHPINPPSNIYHRSMSSFQDGDAVYIMQQDRGPFSYGFSTEAPYRKVSTFELTMIDDGDRDLTLDVYEQNTISEINDNVVIACAINEDIAKGDSVHCRYRYRGIYSPGVEIINPNEPSGGENWSNDHYTIEFYATDGEDKDLQANLYYGNGKDDDWTLINTGELLLVPQETHRVAYDWDVSSVPPGAYYIKAEAQRTSGGKLGFDVSDMRLQVGPYIGFVNNGSTNVTVSTNAFGYLGTNMSFETGDILGWASGSEPTVDIYASTVKAWDGDYGCRFVGNWDDWGWNNAQQEIPCTAGETLHVQGRVYIGSLNKYGTNWLRCGVKMESTNNPNDWAGTEFNTTFTTGVWLNVDFQRTAPASGTDRLMLWVAGHDATRVDVFFDDLKVMSTNTGAIVTNRMRTGYWEGDVAVDVSSHDALSVWVGTEEPSTAVEAWVADSSGQTNAVLLTNYAERVINFAQRVDIPWTDFSSINRSQVKALGFRATETNTITATRVRSITSPVKVSVQQVSPPLYDLSGVPHYNPGQDVISVISIENTSGSPLNDVRVQLLQEYGETTFWTDMSHHDARPSEQTRRGDRLGGDFERNWTNVSIAAGATLQITNVYTLPVGKLIDRTKHAFPTDEDWWVYRNYAAYGQMHLVIRESDGDNVFSDDQVTYYSMDDDFDIDNDELPDSWETQYGGDYVSMRPDEDPDSDGYDNLSEYLAGSDPTDPNSYPGHISAYILHLAYTNGTDLFPQAVAEQTNYTGAACAWMIASYLHETNYPATQTEIYNANTTDPLHNDEITPQSLASWMYQNAPAQYYFSGRYRTNLNEALKESVYWIDYLPPGGKKSPVYILCGTNWSYKVVRGFETDRPPYDGGYGVTTASTYTVYGMWLNDPRMSGIGYDVYATAEEMASIYEASTSDGKYWLVAEPPQDADELSAAEEVINNSTMQIGTADENLNLSAHLADLFAAEGAGAAKDGYTPDQQPNLGASLPQALQADEGFMGLFDQAESTNYYLVNEDDPDNEYILGAGGIRGPGSTVFVLKLGTNGAMHQATWDEHSTLYPPVSVEAAEWQARQNLGLAEGGLPVKAESGNLLLNAGFESNTGTDGIADNWDNSGAAAVQSWAASAGSWGMAFITWDPDHSEGEIYQDYASAEAGSEYTFSVMISKDSGVTAPAVDLKMEYYRADMTAVGSSSVNIYSSLTDSFTRQGITAIAPEETEIIRCIVYAIGLEGAGALKVDEASLTGGTPTLLSNGGFESGSTSGGGTDGWTLGGSAQAETWAYRDGQWGLALASWVASSAYFYQDYASPTSGNEYAFSVWLSRDAGLTASALDVKIEWLDASSGQIGVETYDVAALVNTNWQQFAVTGTAPSGVASIRCTVGATGLGGSGAVKCDDGLLTETAGTGGGGATLVDAQLVYDPRIDASPFLPRWKLVFDDDGQQITNIVDQAVDLSGDSDGDGVSDRDELYAGTDPDDANSAFGISAARSTAGGPETIVVRWPSSTGKQYSLFRGTNLMEGTSLLQSHIDANPPENEYTDTMPAPMTIYRIEVE